MKTIKNLFSVLLCVSLLSCMTVALAEETVTVLGWDEYVDSEVLADFEAETGIRVVWSSMDSIENMLLKVTQGNASEFDLILSSDYSLDILRQADLLQKLDREQLPNYSNLDPLFLSQYYDPDDEYVIPYMAGCPLIVYDPDRVSIEIKGYKDLWDESLEDSVAVLESTRVLLGAALKSMGYSMNETDPAVLDQLKEQIMPLYRNIHVFGDMESYTAVATGESPVGFMFTPFVYLTLMEQPDYQVVYPEEGLGYGIDGFVIPKGCANAENAHAFLNYLMKPEVAAHNAEWQGYLCVNSAAQEHLSEEFRESEVINVPEELLKDAEFIKNIGDTESVYQEIYTVFKNQ